MSDTPIPHRGLLGAWFFDRRFYDNGRNRITPMNPVGYPAELKNGVTVGVEGDPSREFGAADFDAASNQYADVDDPVQVSGAEVVLVWGGLVSDWTDGFGRLISSGNRGSSGVEIFTHDSINGLLSIPITDSNKVLSTHFAKTSIGNNEYFTVVSHVDNNELTSTLFINGNFIESESLDNGGFSKSNQDLGISARTDNTFHLNGECMFGAKYDTAVPDAPEPSKIARRWDRLTDIPATR